MVTEPVTRNGRAARDPVQAAVEEDRGLRQQAVHQVERVHAFKQHAAAFVVGMIVLGGVWALTEYQNADGWPERFSDSAGPGSWNPWFVWVALIWGGILAYHGIKTYFRRPPTEAEVQREIERLQTRS